MWMITMSRVGSAQSRAVPVTRRAPTGSPAPPSCLMPAVSPEPKREMMWGGQQGGHRGDGSTGGSGQAGCNTQTAEMNAASAGHVQGLLNRLADLLDDGRSMNEREKSGGAQTVDDSNGGGNSVFSYRCGGAATYSGLGSEAERNHT